MSLIILENMKNIYYKVLKIKLKLVEYLYNFFH